MNIVVVCYRKVRENVFTFRNNDHLLFYFTIIDGSTSPFGYDCSLIHGSADVPEPHSAFRPSAFSEAYHASRFIPCSDVIEPTLLVSKKRISDLPHD